MQENSMFQRPPLWIQADEVVKKGTLLAKRQYNNWSVSLYALDAGFVEVWASPTIEVIGTFQAAANPMAVLEPYTASIDLEHLL